MFWRLVKASRDSIPPRRPWEIPRRPAGDARRQFVHNVSTIWYQFYDNLTQSKPKIDQKSNQITTKRPILDGRKNCINPTPQPFLWRRKPGLDLALLFGLGLALLLGRGLGLPPLFGLCLRLSAPVFGLVLQALLLDRGPGLAYCIPSSQ